MGTASATTREAQKLRHPARLRIGAELPCARQGRAQPPACAVGVLRRERRGGQVDEDGDVLQGSVCRRGFDDDQRSIERGDARSGAAAIAARARNARASGPGAP